MLVMSIVAVRFLLGNLPSASLIVGMDERSISISIGSSLFYLA